MSYGIDIFQERKGVCMGKMVTMSGLIADSAGKRCIARQSGAQDIWFVPICENIFWLHQHIRCCEHSALTHTWLVTLECYRIRNQYLPMKCFYTERKI
jgi:hypothetical protein